MATGTAAPNAWVPLKVVDAEQSILVFDITKADASGNYSIDFIVPVGAAGTLTVVAGEGGNVNSKSLNVTTSPADTEAPTWTNGSLTASKVGQTTLTLNWSGASDNVGVTGYKVYQDEVVVDTVSSATLTHNVTGLKAGTEYTFKVEAVDAAGNESTGGPSATVTTPQVTVTLNLSKSKAAVGDTVTASGAAAPNAWVPLKVVDAEQSILVFDTTKADASGNYSIDFIVPAGATGTLAVIAGEGSKVATKSLTVTTAPADTEAPAWTNGSMTASNVGQTTLTLNWSGASDNVGVTGYKVYQDGVVVDTVSSATLTYNVTGLKAGTEYTFKVEAVDAAGNESTGGPSATVTTSQVTVTLNLSKSKAAVGDTVTASGAAAPNAWVPLKVVDAEQSILVFDTTKADASGNYSIDFIVPAGAAGTLAVIAGEGSKVATKSLTVTTAPADTEAPAWTNGILTASKVSQTTLALSWSGASDNVGVTSYKVYQDGAVIDTVSSVTLTYNVTGLAPGTKYTFKVKAVDAAGNESTDGPSTTVATQEESQVPVTLNLSKNEAAVGDTVTATGTAAPNAWVPLKVVDAEQSILVFDTTKADASGNYSIDFIVPIGAAGTLTVVAGEGSNVDTKSLTVTGTLPVDTEAPTWTDGSLTASNVGQTTLTLTWSAASDNVGVTGYKVYQDGILLTDTPVTGTSYNVTDLTPDTTYTFTVQAGDAAGNWSTDGPSTTVTPKMEGCFIATAAYGSYLDPHVQVLRDFRDGVLLMSPLGRWFVTQYYQNSPPLAAVIAQSDTLRFVARSVLTPVIYTVEYPIVSSAVLLLVFGFVVIILRQRRRLYQKL